MNLGSLGSLFIDMRADTAQFETDMGRAQRVSQQRAEAIQKGIQNAAKNIAAALAAIDVGRRMGDGIKNAIDQADQLSKSSQKLGIGIKELSGLKFAADFSDVDFGSLETGLAKFNQTVHMAIEGSREQKSAFDALGISLTDAAGHYKSTDQYVNEVADAFQHSQDTASKTAVAMALFGRAGADMIPLLNGGSQGIADMTAQAERLGLVIEKTTGKAAEDYNDHLNMIAKTTEGLYNRVADNLLPTLNDLATQYQAWATDSKNVANATEVINTGVRLVIVSALVAKGAFVDLGTVIGGLAAAGQQLHLNWSDMVVPGKAIYKFAKNGDAAMAVMKEAFSDARDSTSKDIEAIVKAWEAGNKAIDKASQTPAGKPPGSKDDGRKVINFGNSTAAYQAVTDQAAQKKRVDDMIASLADQSATLGYNARALDLYRAAAEGASNAQLDMINQLHDNIDAFNAAQKAVEDYQKQQEQLQQMVSSFKDAPQYSGIDAVVGGSFGELGKIDDAGQQLEKWYDNQLQMLDEFRKDRADLQSLWDDKEAQLEQEHQDHLLALEKARQIARLDVLSETFSNIATLSESGNKKLAAIGKASAIAQATIDGILAVQKALAAAPPPLNFVLAGAVGVAQAVNVAKISGVGFESGGYTGDFGTKQVAGVVHGREFVVNAAATARYRGVLEAMNSAPNVPGMSAMASGGGNRDVRVISELGFPVQPVPFVRHGELAVRLRYTEDVASVRGYAMAVHDAENNGPMTKAQNDRTGVRRLPKVARR
ncbi:hypothetical protein [Solimonas marina]|uniref:Uncharacterized protein n=1 Tax=Solimonas marina TaxID=2714601 RepID=A0A970B987_9GAMM|nr:hypothetical protein [Solimonas marina]NKF23064.1 hypothetical protein [Solimonas marina]